MVRTHGVRLKVGAEVGAMRPTIGERVRAAREGYGMTQVELAARAGVSKTSMNNLEQGLTRDPHVSVLMGIARALGTTVDALVGMEALTRRRDEARRQAHEPMW